MRAERRAEGLEIGLKGGWVDRTVGLSKRNCLAMPVEFWRKSEPKNRILSRWRRRRKEKVDRRRDMIKRVEIRRGYGWERGR